MQNAQLMQRLKASPYLNHDLPYSIFFPKLLFVLMLANPLENITVVRKFHHNAMQESQNDHYTFTVFFPLWYLNVRLTRAS